MNGFRTHHCTGRRGAACLGAGIVMLLSPVAVYAQHLHATQHPHIAQHPNLSCPHGLGHLPGHHGHLCRPGSTPFLYESPSYNDYQYLMDFDMRPPTDLGSLPSQIKQIQQIQERVNRETLRIIAYQRKLQQQIRAQTSWGTRGAGRNINGPKEKLYIPDSSLSDSSTTYPDEPPEKATSGRLPTRSEGTGRIHNNTSRSKVILNPFCKEDATHPKVIINPFCK